MPKTHPISVIIADDEPSARQLLQHFIDQIPDLKMLASCPNGDEALSQINTQQPDLVFLDIEMPGIDGVELVNQLQAPMPLIIFVTAYNQYAVKAFEQHAVDYLLKPFDEERLLNAIDRARERLKRPGQQSKNELSSIRSMLEQLPPFSNAGQYLKKIPCKQRGKISLIDVNDVIWIESEGAFCKLHTPWGTELTNHAIGHLEESLDPKTHLRIHKSHIVNLNEIKTIEPYFHGEYSLLLKNGITLKLSRGYKSRIGAILNQYK